MPNDTHNFIKLVFGGLVLIGLGTTLARGSTAALPVVSDQVGQWFAHLAVMARQTRQGTEVHYQLSADDPLWVAATSRNLQISTETNLTASAYELKDLSTGHILAAANADKALPIASLTKLVTAAVARRVLNQDQPISGTPLTVGETLYPLLMVSSNEAALHLAEAYGYTAFVQAMNSFAAAIGTKHTFFADPSGLSAQNQASADDIIRIIDWLRTHDQTIMGITTLKSKTIHGETWVNPAHFLSWSYYLGGKNGYTDAADRTGVVVVALGAPPQIYAAAVLGSDDRDGDVLKLLSLIK